MVTTSRFTVIVVDENDNPIENAKVTASGETKYTSENGTARFNLTRFSYVSVEVTKSGYEDGFGGGWNYYGEQKEYITLYTDETDTIWQRIKEWLHQTISIGWIDTDIPYWTLILGALFIIAVMIVIWLVIL